MVHVTFLPTLELVLRDYCPSSHAFLSLFLFTKTYLTLYFCQYKSVAVV